jgi:soluble lytic murein transglycosylase-like protein
MSTAPPTRESLIALARAAAAAHSLDPALVCAVVEQESAWNSWAIRFEPGFLARYVAPLHAAGKISATEAYARSFSWGLMQVMGQVAREHGFGSPPSDTAVIPSGARDLLLPAPSSSSVIPSRIAGEGYPGEQYPPGVSAPLSQLCDPATGLDIGCRVLAHKFASAGTNKSAACSAPDITVIERALTLWNGGADPDYAAQVLARLSPYQVQPG